MIKNSSKNNFLNADIADEKLTTVIIGIERLLNLRFLTHQTGNSQEEVSLIPSDFFKGQGEHFDS